MQRLIFLLFLVGCDHSIESDRRCQLKSEGWVCDEDMADSVPDLDNGDMAQPTPDLGEQDTGSLDMSPVEDMETVPDMPLPPATSCAELRERGESTGAHTIRHAGQDYEVWCEMEFDSGAWMLIGRSAAGGSGSFGWRSQAGSLDNMAAPYSLGLVDFPFTEILVAAQGAGNSVGDRAYRIAAPADFWSSCQSTVCAVSVVPTAGTCNNVSMLNQTGQNTVTDHFFFRDVPEFVPYGLFPQGFNTFYEDCVGGELNSRQGLIFIR